MTLAVRIEEQELDQLAIALFTKHESQFTPLHPWVLVRVLPREQRVGQIWLPNNKSQNKPVHEGIVLSTWKQFTSQKGKLIQTELVPGDHVCYPHWAGQPVPGWDERYYVCVPEQVKESVGIDKTRVILGKLNYPKVSTKEAFKNVLVNCFPNHLEDAIDVLHEHFDIVSKEGYSKTTSGK